MTNAKLHALTLTPEQVQAVKGFCPLGTIETLKRSEGHPLAQTVVNLADLCQCLSNRKNIARDEARTLGRELMVAQIRLKAIEKALAENNGLGFTQQAHAAITDALNAVL
jgi:hypothetical protein